MSTLNIYTTLQKENKAWIGRLILLRCQLSPKLIHRFKAILIKT